MVERATEMCGLMVAGGGNPKSVQWNDQAKSERKYLEPEMKMQRKDVCKFTKKKIERLKGVYIKVKRMFMNSLEGRLIKK